MKIVKKRKDIPEIYIGPTMKKYGLNSGSVFVGNLPANIQDALEKFPIVKELFVPADENFPVVKKNLKEEGTRVNILYKKIIKVLKEENNV